MNTQQPQEKGVATRPFIIFSFFTLVALFLLGWMVSPDTRPTLSVFLAFCWHFVSGTIFALGFGLVLTAIVWGFVLDEPFRIAKVIAAFQTPSNDSYSWVFSTFMLLVPVEIVILAGGASTFQHLVGSALTKGSIGLGAAGIVTIALSYLIGLRNLDQFKGKITETHNNNFVITVCFIFVSFVALAMSLT